MHICFYRYKMSIDMFGSTQILQAASGKLPEWGLSSVRYRPGSDTWCDMDQELSKSMARYTCLVETHRNFMTFLEASLTCFAIRQSLCLGLTVPRTER